VEVPPGEKVIMEVPHRLAAVVVAVDDEAEAALGKSLLPGNLAGDKGNMPHEGGVFLGEIDNGGNVAAGDDQVVEGGLGGNIFYDDDGFVMVDDIPRMLFGDDAAEYA
jgi:hypothetical protein